MHTFSQSHHVAIYGFGLAPPSNLLPKLCKLHKQSDALSQLPTSELFNSLSRLLHRQSGVALLEAFPSHNTEIETCTLPAHSHAVTMTEPTHWQIAPEYEHGDDSSDSESTVTEDEEEVPQEEVRTPSEQIPALLNIEKAETQDEDGTSAPPTRPTTLQKARTKSSRSQAPPDPVGFWHYQMVCCLASMVDACSDDALGRREASCYQPLAAHE